MRVAWMAPFYEKERRMKLLLIPLVDLIYFFRGTWRRLRDLVHESRQDYVSSDCLKRYL